MKILLFLFFTSNKNVKRRIFRAASRVSLYELSHYTRMCTFLFLCSGKIRISNQSDIFLLQRTFIHWSKLLHSHHILPLKCLLLCKACKYVVMLRAFRFFPFGSSFRFSFFWVFLKLVCLFLSPKMNKRTLAAWAFAAAVTHRAS